MKLCDIQIITADGTFGDKPVSYTHLDVYKRQVLNGEEIDKVRATILINGALNAKIVGQSAHTIAALAGVEDAVQHHHALLGSADHAVVKGLGMDDGRNRQQRCV